MEKTKTFVRADEQSKISRKLLVWLNTAPEKPVSRINYEYLGDVDGVVLSTIQGAYKTRQYIGGGYRAQYQFKLIYRTHPSTNDERLTAEEAVNAFGAWATDNVKNLYLDENMTVVSLTQDTVAALFARYEGGAEDYQILMTLTYEVNV